MYFREKALLPAPASEPNLTPILSALLQEVLETHGLAAGFLCSWDDGARKAQALATWNIPIEPFKGSKSAELSEFVTICVDAHCAPHTHKCHESPLWREIERVTEVATWRKQVLFMPAFSGDYDFVVIAFSTEETEIKVSVELTDSVRDMMALASFLLSAGTAAYRLRTIELYVREVGHDIASSVQAISAKLRNVSRGLVKGDAAIQKVREAEKEMMAAYRSADTLGVTVDPDYNLSTAEWFNLSEAIREVIELCKSEAEERNIEIRSLLPANDLQLWGDQKAIQSAATQLLLNAIKYGKGSSFVELKLFNLDTQAEITVTDRGMPLDDDERLHMWDFGWRGKRAKEMHVNGSGIGLYTVQKIARAHGGRWGSAKHKVADDVAIFFFTIPKK